MKQELVQFIDKSIKELWLNEVQSDYKASAILKEDTLKNSVYHHLRNRITCCEQQGIRVYTEFSDSSFRGTGLRADIAVVKLRDNLAEYYLGDNIEGILAIIELKFKGYRCTPDMAMSDIKKLNAYIRKYNMNNCQMYLGIMHEYSYPISELTWVSQKASSTWAKGIVSELTACKFDGGGDDMKFIVHSYNNYNSSLNCTDITSIQ